MQKNLLITTFKFENCYILSKTISIKPAANSFWVLKCSHIFQVDVNKTPPLSLMGWIPCTFRIGYIGHNPRCQCHLPGDKQPFPLSCTAYTIIQVYHSFIPLMIIVGTTISYGALHNQRQYSKYMYICIKIVL